MSCVCVFVCVCGGGGGGEVSSCQLITTYINIYIQSTGYNNGTGSPLVVSHCHLLVGGVTTTDRRRKKKKKMTLRVTL